MKILALLLMIIYLNLKHNIVCNVLDKLPESIYKLHTILKPFDTNYCLSELKNKCFEKKTANLMEYCYLLESFLT